MMVRNALDAFGQQFTRRRVADVTQTEDAHHSFALVDHRQPADPQRLHVPHRLGQVIVFPAAMYVRGHDIARRRLGGVVLESGRVMLHGRSSELLLRADVRDVYLGIT
jgi:hypothetical protein